MSSRVSNDALLEAGLALMRAAGKPLKKLPTSSRAMKYALSDGSTVRVRTCNDHILVVLAESAKEGARLNIEGTDHLLIVMPEVPRTDGSVIAYFIPTEVAVSAVRRAHAEWLASTPSTKGNNRTWNIWFDDGVTKSGGFARKWVRYRLGGNASTLDLNPQSQSPSGGDGRQLGAVIAEARKSIALAAGVSVDAVKITIAMG